MNSHQEHNSTVTLEYMLRELSEYKRDRDVILTEAVRSRLNESLSTYYKSLEAAQTKLEYQNNLKVIRAINKYE